MARMSQATVTLSEQQLESLIRKIVREELTRLLQRQPELVESWMSDPESPLYQEMIALQEEARSGRMELLGDDEVWGK